MTPGDIDTSSGGGEPFICVGLMGWLVMGGWLEVHMDPGAA